MQEGDGADEFRVLYARSYARLVGVVGAVGRDRDEAEEAVQDAFVRLLGQWYLVQDYDDLEAWVRKAAFGYLSKRHRKMRNGLRAVRRHGVAPDVPGPSSDAVDLHRALASLPLAHRQVIVLQHLGLSVDDIARELGVPGGTVKSRLARARAALAPLLREDVTRHV